MKRLSLLLSFLLVSCASNSRYTRTVANVMPTVVMLEVDVEQYNPYTEEVQRGTYAGSGVIISPTGHILTCAHLFDATVLSARCLLKSGETVPLQILRIDPVKDLALCRITPPAGLLPYSRLAPNDELKQGQEVIAIGYPQGLEWSTTVGVVSGLDRNIGGFFSLVQNDVAINGGNSGGPLFDLDGQIVGINNLILSPVHAYTGISFAVSTATIRDFLGVFAGLEVVE